MSMTEEKPKRESFITKIKNAIARWRIRRRIQFNNIKRQFANPDIETLAGATLGASWGRIFSALYLGIIAVTFGIWWSAATLFMYVVFEYWISHHLAIHFHTAIENEIAYLKSQLSTNPVSTMRLIPVN